MRRRKKRWRRGKRSKQGEARPMAGNWRKRRGQEIFFFFFFFFFPPEIALLVDLHGEVFFEHFALFYKQFLAVARHFFLRSVLGLPSRHRQIHAWREGEEEE